MDRHRLPIAAAVIVQDRHVLLGRRVAVEPGLEWQFPAGKIEPGETAKVAAVREAAEEVALAVTATGRLGERVHPMTARRIIYVMCAVVSGTARPADGELAEVAWVGLADLPTYVRYGFYGPVQAHLNVVLSP